MDKRVQRQDASIEIEKLRLQAQIEKAKTLATVESDYDLEVLRQSQYTWSDEILVFCTVVLAASAFHPEYSDFALKGFKIWEQMPMWYQLVLAGIYIRVLGIRFLFPNVKTIFGWNKNK